MSLIRRNTTRTIKNITETTQQTDTPSATTLAFNLQTTDAFYLGYKKPFAARYFHCSVLNATPSVLAVTYWDGTTWTAVEDLIDQTSGFTASGFISWQNPGQWKVKALTPVVDQELYWLRIKVGTNLDSGTILQAVLNIYCDDALVRSYYPEFLSNTTWLPPGRTDFLEQYVAAKDLVVKMLKAEGSIKDENQIIDPNEVAIATVHAFAWILMNPVSKNDADTARVEKAWKDMAEMLSRAHFDVDLNNDGKTEPAEEKAGTVYRARG